MKNKTLKDFDCKGCYCALAPRLKAEAIKWVKEDLVTYSLMGGIPEITKEWMKRLDITEEDLK